MNHRESAMWRRVNANCSDANMAESVMQAAAFYIDGFGVAGLSFSHYRHGKGCTYFSDRETAAGRVVCVQWNTCCEQHPIVIESVEFMGK